MKLLELTSFLESFAPLAFQEDYDNSGLLAGRPEQEISAALICLDITLSTIEEAISRDCNLIIAHHPFIFHGLKKIEPGKMQSDILISLIKHDIAVYAIHTNLDNAVAGLNEFLCIKLGISNAKILSEKHGMLFKLVTFCPLGHAEKVRQALFDAGAGVIGKYDFCSYNMSGQGTFRASADTNPFVGKQNSLHIEDETRIEVIFPGFIQGKLVKALLSVHPYEEVAYDLYPLSNSFSGCGAGMIGELEHPTSPLDFMKLVKNKLNVEVIRHSQFPGKKIKKVAICSGSGSFLIPEALRAGADVLLTADVKYHDFFDVNGRILLADIGHYESEQWIKDLLTEKLIEKFPTFAVLSSGLNTNPVNYL
ncbi:MAG: Nif3-like dinuclear metal center hexameric protein [Bacteroidetes bacterium]|nr:Nif3-like dinuclear metal center hexameric protein [Bacteroidota bacterium]